MLSGQLLLGVVTTVVPIRNWLLAAHDRSLSRSVRSDRPQRGRALVDGDERLRPALSDSVVSTTARHAGRVLRGQGERARASPAEENTLVKQGSALPTAGLASPTDPTQYGDEQDTKALLKAGVVGAGGVEPPSSATGGHTTQSKRWLCDIDCGHGFWTPLAALAAGMAAHPRRSPVPAPRSTH